MYYEAIGAVPALSDSSVPKKYWPMFVHVGGSAEVLRLHAQIFRENGIGPGSSALVIGVFGGRDYYHCQSLGMRVSALDLAHLPEFNNDVGSVEDDLPYADASFDVVIIREVLEHLWDDTRAMKNLRRVLKPTGILVVAVPYFDDDDEFHVRMHSPFTLHKLAAHTGWDIVEEIERPALVRAPSALGSLLKGVSVAVFACTRINLFKLYVPLWSAFENATGRLLWLGWLRKFSSNYGVTAVLKPSKNSVDNRRVQIDYFCETEVHSSVRG
jgi:SAM-dependent methyltransferase